MIPEEKVDLDSLAVMSIHFVALGDVAFFFGGCAAEYFPASSAISFHTSPMSGLPGPVSTIATVGYHGKY